VPVHARADIGAPCSYLCNFDQLTSRKKRIQMGFVLMRWKIDAWQGERWGRALPACSDIFAWQKMTGRTVP